MSGETLDLAIQVAIYRHFADEARAPDPEEIAAATDTTRDEVVEAYRRLRERRLLYLEPDGRKIRMAPPFSGVPTQHVAAVGGKRYAANCAWDVLGIVAALRRAGRVESRCEQSLEPLVLEIDDAGRFEPCGWLFHCLVPAARWWDDLVFT